MRVLNVVHQYLPDRIGGTELYTQALSQALADRGHRVGIFYRSQHPAEGVRSRSDEGGISVWSASSGPMSAAQRFLSSYRNEGLLAAFRAVLSEFRPDLVHIQHLMGLPVDFGPVLERTRLPYVITLWDFWWRCANAQLLTNYSGEICPGPSTTFLNCAHCAVARAGHPNLIPALPLVAPLMARRNAALQPVIDGAARLIAPTEFVRKWYVDHGFPAHKMVVLPPALAYPAPAESASQPAGDRPLRVVYVGGLSSQKGVHVLIEAFAGLQGAAELWVAGELTADPAYSDRLRAMAGPNVHFLGRLERQRVWETLAAVDVVAVPTLWYETYSFIISEAFVAGRPVLASRLGPIADRVRDGEDGYLLPPGDVAAWRSALQRLLDSPSTIAALAAGVRPPPSLSEHASDVEALYRQVFDAGRAAPTSRA